MQRLLPVVTMVMLWMAVLVLGSVVATVVTSTAEEQAAFMSSTKGQPNQTTTAVPNDDLSRSLAIEDGSSSVVVDDFAFVTSYHHDPFFKSCKILKSGMKYAWNHAVTCECDETKWEAVCSIRYTQLNNCLNNDDNDTGAEYAAAGRPCTSNMTASFVRPGADEQHSTMASMDQFRLCSVFASTPRKEACVTFQYSNGSHSVPFDCEVSILALVDGDGGGTPHTCRSCRVCGRSAFTVDCGNVLPLQLETCQVFDRPELDFFTQLSPLNTGPASRLESELRLVTKDVPQQSKNDDFTPNVKTSNSVSVLHSLVALFIGLAASVSLLG